MWFIADLYQRYTNSVANAFLRIAALEAEANRRALERQRTRRQASGLIVEEREVYVRPAMVHPESGEALTEAHAKEMAIATVEAVRAEPAKRPCVIEKATAVRELPMGVRADVVAKWLERFAAAGEADAAALVAKLSKDKKVRVAELQFIAADLLDEEPTHRKKADHLAAIRHYLMAERDSAHRAELAAIAAALH